ncbi:dynein axonemal assembly factor 6 [Tiliqua scincoides]|uniref:dynein axonemal assembly factor 6 n=1 Tax=Tiliqua scincoides TaxID=71010 RepID=UPI0034625EDE
MADALLALAELLAPRPEDGDEEGERGPRGAVGAASRTGPGAIGPPGRDALPETPARSGGEIWSAEEVPAEGCADLEAAWDPREQPEHEVLFRQRVGAEDVFLGVSGRDPSSACCEELLVRVRLPGARASDISLDVREKVLDLRSPQKRLFLHLPHPVDAKSGRACFLAEKGTLEVTLRIQRELDFINFA